MKQILIATHGKMASGIRYTAELIVGRSEEITTIDAYVNPEDDIEAQFKEYFADHAKDRIFVFTDLMGGSVNQKLMKYAESENVTLITGTNLAVLMQVMMSDEDVTDVEIEEFIDEARQELQWVHLETEKKTVIAEGKIPASEAASGTASEAETGAEQKEENSEIQDVTEAISELSVKEEAVQLEKKRWGTGEALITAVKCFNREGKETSMFETGDKIQFQIFYKVNQTVKEANFGIGIFRTDGLHCFGTNMLIDKCPKFDLTQDGMVELTIDAWNLLPGEYDLDFAIGAEGCADIDYYKKMVKLQVFSELTDIGVVRLSHSWKVSERKKDK